MLLSVLYADSYSVFRLCPKDEWLFIKYPRKNRELILAPILLAERQRETASESESGREKEREREQERESEREQEEKGKERKEEERGYRGKEAKHPSAFNSVNWINAELCGMQQMWMRGRT